jgi:hypothetical protein
MEAVLDVDELGGDAKAEVRASTRSPWRWVRALISSSAMPSPK